MKGLLRQQEKMAGGAGRTEGGGGTGANEAGAPDHCSGGLGGQGDPVRVEVTGGLDHRSGAVVPGGAEEPWRRCRRWRQGTVGAEELATTQRMGRPSSRGAGDMEGRNSAAAEGRDDGGVSAAAAREEGAGGRARRRAQG